MIRRLLFHLWYFRRPPWDTGISPPELLEFIQSHPPGRAIDLGCGTGTNVITLAQHGWQVTGVDFAPRAIRLARQKAQRANVQATLRTADVTHLNDIEGPFDLALDMGCFHGLGEKKEDYLTELKRILAPGGYWLLYGFFAPAASSAGPGLVAADLERIHARGFRLLWRKDGQDRRSRPSAWFLFQRPP